MIGAIPAGLPAPSPARRGPRRPRSLLLPAVAVAALGALESLMSATVADGMSVGERHDPDRELFGQGVANLVTPLFGGIPATAAIARTAVNVRSGARSRLAAITHSLALLVVVLVAAQWVAYIPLAALAGVLTRDRRAMVEASSLSALLRSTRGDAAALVITAGATILLDLVTAVVLGLVVAGAFALQQVARSAQPRRAGARPRRPRRRGARAVRRAHRRLPARRPAVLRAAHTFLLELSEVAEVKVVILRMSRVATLDATGATVLADTIKRLEGRGITVLLSGVRPEHRRVLDRLGVFEALATSATCSTTRPRPSTTPGCTRSASSTGRVRRPHRAGCLQANLPPDPTPMRRTGFTAHRREGMMTPTRR